MAELTAHSPQDQKVVSSNLAGSKKSDLTLSESRFASFSHVMINNNLNNYPLGHTDLCMLVDLQPKDQCIWVANLRIMEWLRGPGAGMPWL